MSLDHQIDTPSQHSRRASSHARPVPTVTVEIDGAKERLTPDEWIDAYINNGGSFTRGRGHFLVGRPVPCSEALKALMRSVGDLPMPNGRCVRKRKAFNEAVVLQAERLMDRLGTDILVDMEAWIRSSSRR